jgi:phosphoribosylanthranilate isomerase
LGVKRDAVALLKIVLTRSARIIVNWKADCQCGGSMIIQIYEIQTVQEAERCISLGVDHIGSVVLSQSAWRDPSLKEVVRLCRGTNARSSLIPLFRDPTILYRTLDYYQPHFVHFCESLTDPQGRVKSMEPFIQLQEGVKTRFPELAIMRSIPIPAPNYHGDFPALQIAEALEPFSDWFLADTWMGEAPVEGFIGITGQKLDWEVAAALTQRTSRPVILAGGLSPENVTEGILKVLPAGADSCTRTNTLDGQGRHVRFRKDFHKVARFVEGVRRAEGLIQGLVRDLQSEIRSLEQKLRMKAASLSPTLARPPRRMVLENLEQEIRFKSKALERLCRIHGNCAELPPMRGGGGSQ